MGKGSEHQEQVEQGKVQRGLFASVLKRDRRSVYISLILFFGLFVIAVSFISAYSMSYKNQRTSAASYNASNAQPNPDCIDPIGPMKLLYCAYDLEKAQHEKKHAEADLKAQQDMSVWTHAMLWVGLGGVIISIVGVALIYETLKETREMTSITRIVAGHQLRPYLSVLSVYLDAEEGKTPRQLVVEIQNGGATIALQTRVDVFIKCDGIFIQEEFGEYLRTESEPFKFPIGPNQTVKIRRDIDPKWMKQLKDGHTIWAAGRIQYNDAQRAGIEDGGTKRTMFRFFITQSIIDGRNKSDVDKRIHLRRTNNGNNAI